MRLSTKLSFKFFMTLLKELNSSVPFDLIPGVQSASYNDQLKLGFPIKINK